MNPKVSEIIWGVLYYFISAVLLFSGVSKIFDPSPMIETMKADLLSTFELSSTDTGTFNPHQAAIAWQSENTDLSLVHYSGAE